MTQRSTLTPHNLPTWMRRAIRPPDWAAVLAFAFSLLIASPILFTPGLPRTNDNEHWVYQTANYAKAFSEGRLYPRWSPHALGGYGAPIPNYYPPAPAYSAALLETTFTGQSLDAVRILYVLTLSLSALPVYALVARHHDARSGLFASLLYATCPYINFTTPIVLGDLPATLSHLMLPFMLWAFDRLLTARQPIDLATSTLATSALVLTDVRFALVGGVLLTVLFAWHASHHRKVTLYPALASMILGVLIAAFFWLPALLEQNAVQWQYVASRQTPELSFAALIETMRQLDPAESNQQPQVTLGNALAVFAAASAVAFLIRKAKVADLLWWLTSLVCIAIVVSFAQVWLIGGAALALCLASPAALTLFRGMRPRLRLSALTMSLVIVLMNAVPLWLTPRSWERTIDTSPSAQLQYELQGFGIAGLPTGWGIPTTLNESTTYNAALIASYNNDQIEKMDPQAIPPGVQIGFLAHDTHTTQFQVQSDFATTLTVMTAAFPGWSATATSANITLGRDPISGLLQLNLPNGINSDISVTLGTTPIRTLAWATSAIALLGTYLLVRRRQRSPYDYLADYPLLKRSELLATSAIWLLSAAILMATLFGTFDVLRARPGSGLQSSIPLRINTDAGIEAIAYREERDGAAVNITFYWRALRPLERNLRVQVTLIDPTTTTVLLQSTIQHPGGYPSRRWLTNHYISDHHRLTLPETASDLPVAAHVEVFDCATICTEQNRISFYDAQGAFIGQTLTLPVGS
jgi:hypothetical protein